MSGDTLPDPDHNPPLSQVLAKGPDHLVKPLNVTSTEPPPATRHGVAPKPPIEPRPTAKEITYDPDAYRDPFGRQH